MSDDFLLYAMLRLFYLILKSFKDFSSSESSQKNNNR